MTWFEVFGWIGSGLVVLSLMLASTKRFRWFNFWGCVIAVIYNGVLAIWPFFAMNFAIAVIDAYWLYKIYRDERLNSPSREVRTALGTEDVCHHCGSHLKAKTPTA